MNRETYERAMEILFALDKCIDKAILQLDDIDNNGIEDE